MVTAALLVGPVSGASASKASIKSALKSYNGKIAIAEGHTLTAFGEYKTSKDAAPVEAAIAGSIKVLGELRAKIAHQSAGTTKVKQAKSKLLKGIEAVIVAYGKLKTSVGEKASDPQSAETEAKEAVAAVKAGRKQLVEAAKLLK